MAVTSVASTVRNGLGVAQNNQRVLAEVQATKAAPQQQQRRVPQQPATELIFNHREEVTAALGAGLIDVSTALAAVERLAIASAVAKTKGGYSLSFKVAQKGGLSVYGLQRNPVTLYVEQFEALLDAAESIRAFIKKHENEFVRKTR